MYYDTQHFLYRPEVSALFCSNLNRTLYHALRSSTVINTLTADPYISSLRVYLSDNIYLSR